MVTVRKQPLQSGRPGRAFGFVGFSWYKTADGSLVNLSLAQSVQVYDIDREYQAIATFNDGTETVLWKSKIEHEVWSFLDSIAEQIVRDYKIATTRVRLGHG